MSHMVTEFRKLRNKGLKQPLVRGTVPKVVLPPDSLRWIGGLVFSGSAIAIFVPCFLVLLWQGMSVFAALDHAGSFALIGGTIGASLYYLFPFLRIAGFVIRHGQRPSRQLLAEFSYGQKFACLCVIAFSLLYGFSHIYPDFVFFWRYEHWPPQYAHFHPYLKLSWHFAAIVLIMAIVLACVVPILFPKHTKLRNHKLGDTSNNQLVINNKGVNSFGLWLGRSTGYLASLWHRTGVAPGLEITLSLEDASQNILVLGGIGSGKTTRLMQPLLAQLLDQDCGGLLFDVKGDVKHAAIQLIEMTNRNIHCIGPGHMPMNLLEGLSPEMAASFLKSAFLLNGKNHNEAFWIDTATELCRNLLGMLSFLPEHYSLQELHRYLFDVEHHLTIDEALTTLSVTLEEENLKLLQSYWHYQERIFDYFDEKVKTGVKATIAQVLSPFNHPELINAFCKHTPNNLFMQSVLDGAIYLVDMPLARWGIGAKVAYTFIKLRFFNVMQNRQQQSNVNQKRPVFFMCDEYQDLVSANKDGLSDLNFWDKSRSSKTIGIISTQSISSVYAALSDRDLAHALLQNFRQKICFRTEDLATLTLMNNLAGQAKVLRKTTSHTEGSSRGAWTEPTSKHESASQSITEVREAVLDATLFRNLSTNQAVALLSLQGHSMDDVIEMNPLYLD